jgi:THO complex subunit 2
MSSEQAAHLLPSTLTTLPALSLLPANSSAAKHSAAERRKRTAIFYKQKKYNVSREASEGYTAFLVLLSDDRYLRKGGEDEDATDRKRRAKALWKECLAVIGWYDLSPQRILDLMLDAFCQKLALHWRFFIDLLECSPWSRRNLCSARSDGDEDVEEGAMETDEPAKSRGMTDFKARLGEETGNRVLTQVLGFKFASHRYDDRDLKGVEQDPTAASQELFYVTAILIKQGLIRTVDILNHLTPDDTTMDSLVRAYKIKTQQDIRNLGGNALVMAAALPDDDSPSGAAAKASTDADIPKPRKEIPEQKIQLCEALLAIGQISSAFYIISRWPIVAQYSERVAILIMRIVRYALKPAYDIVEAARNEGMPPPGLNYRTHFAFGEPEVVDSLYCPEPIDTERRRFRFFFRGWTSQLERWTDPAEVISKVQPLMSIVGARAASDASVLIWLCRLGVYHTTQDVRSPLSISVSIREHTLIYLYIADFRICTVGLGQPGQDQLATGDAATQRQLRIQQRTLAPTATSSLSIPLLTVRGVAYRHVRQQGSILYPGHGIGGRSDPEHHQADSEANDERAQSGPCPGHRQRQLFGTDSSLASYSAADHELREHD